MILYWQKHVGGYVGGHHYLTSAIRRGYFGISATAPVDAWYEIIRFKLNIQRRIEFKSDIEQGLRAALAINRKTSAALPINRKIKTPVEL